MDYTACFHRGQQATVHCPYVADGLDRDHEIESLNLRLANCIDAKVRRPRWANLTPRNVDFFF